MLSERALRIQEAPSREDFLAAIDELIAARTLEALLLLIKALRSTDSAVCDRIVAGIVDFGPMAVQPLITNLDDHDYAARYQSYRALVQLADPSCFETFVWGLREDFAPSVRRIAAKGLAVLQDLRGIPILLSVLKDSDWAVRYAVVLALETFIWAPEVQAALITMVDDKERIIQLKAREILGRRQMLPI